MLFNPLLLAASISFVLSFIALIWFWKKQYQQKKIQRVAQEEQQREQEKLQLQLQEALTEFQGYVQDHSFFTAHVYQEWKKRHQELREHLSTYSNDFKASPDRSLFCRFYDEPSVREQYNQRFVQQQLQAHWWIERSAEVPDAFGPSLVSHEQKQLVLLSEKEKSTWRTLRIKHHQAHSHPMLLTLIKQEAPKIMPGEKQRSFASWLQELAEIRSEQLRSGQEMLAEVISSSGIFSLSDNRKKQPSELVKNVQTWWGYICWCKHRKITPHRWFDHKQQDVPWSPAEESEVRRVYMAYEHWLRTHELVDEITITQLAIQQAPQRAKDYQEILIWQWDQFSHEERSLLEEILDQCPWLQLTAMSEGQAEVEEAWDIIFDLREARNEDAFKNNTKKEATLQDEIPLDFEQYQSSSEPSFPRKQKENIAKGGTAQNMTELPLETPEAKSPTVASSVDKGTVPQIALKQQDHFPSVEEIKPANSAISQAEGKNEVTEVVPSISSLPVHQESASSINIKVQTDQQQESTLDSQSNALKDLDLNSDFPNTKKMTTEPATKESSRQVLVDDDQEHSAVSTSQDVSLQKAQSSVSKTMIQSVEILSEQAEERAQQKKSRQLHWQEEDALVRKAA